MQKNMHHLFDFGMSQEDPRTEFNVLNIQPEDRILCVASGGEIPLSLICLEPNAQITAVDVSQSQLMLCRLKMYTAIVIPFPQNGEFLGYSKATRSWRRETYYNRIYEYLPTEDRNFWDRNLAAIENGVVNYGRFETYIKNIRWILRLIIGKKNIKKLLQESTVADQEYNFDKYIGSRKAVKYLFRIAFHPAIYKNRGLSSQALINAQPKMGDIFFNKFRNFCVATTSTRNYFLHFFLATNVSTCAVFPEYLQEEYRSVLTEKYQNIVWRETSLQNALQAGPAGTFNKIHLSNIGDWMDENAFADFLDILLSRSTKSEKLCYRFLQKNHFVSKDLQHWGLHVKSVCVEKTDRFPFYSVLLIQTHG